MPEENVVNLPDVSDDIIFWDILPRLPVKSIIPWKCISRRWRSLLSDPEFAKFQFKSAHDHQTLRQRLLDDTTSSRAFKSLDLDAPSSSFVDAFGDVSSVTTLTFPARSHRVRLLASCNGLVFVRAEVDVCFEKCAEVNVGFQCIPIASYYIWNPSLGLSRKLPEPTSFSSSISSFGFGYVSAADDYKILLTTCSDQNIDAEIFSSRANIWKRIDIVPDIYDREGFGWLLFNEALYWAGRVVNGYILHVFNLEIEVFQIVPLHIEYEDDDDDADEEGANGRCCVGVVVVGGNLCVWHSRVKNYDLYIDLWVKRKHDVVSDSWTKLYSLMVDCHPTHGELCHVRPVFISESTDAVVLVLESRRFRWDVYERLIKTERKEVKLVNDKLYSFVVCTGLYELQSSSDHSKIMYNESLLWLNDDHGMEGQETEKKEKTLKATDFLGWPLSCGWKPIKGHGLLF